MIFSSEDVERSRMNRGGPYNRLDPTLVDDRKRCRRALARYDAACKIDSGMDESQVRHMLEMVFDPTRDTSHKFKTMPERRGTLSHRVTVEAPFFCTYGYNLNIFDSVYVGENTSIDDAARVEIGARTVIGSNVKIITSEPCKDVSHRQGSDGRWTAKAVYVGTGCILGDNVIVYPDVRLGNNVVVEAGTIVNQSVPEHAALCPPQSLRSCEARHSCITQI